MMFNGLLMCVDSDTSDFTKDSISASSASAADTCSSAWDADARATYYHAKLLSTLQVLQNKEETVRIQAESLRVAEARIAQLTARAHMLREQLDAKAAELRSAQSAARAHRADVATDAAAQEVKTQKALVRTLETNLSVIEDLYGECFYETVKQEQLIEVLRQSYLDARAEDRQKREDTRRQVDQHWSLEQCQGIATEVDNLKLEISNFLNSSNNDSGMWERGEDSLPSEVLDDLHHIGDQLLQLRTMLTGNCTCGLEEENLRLKTANETLVVQMSDYQQRVCELETTVSEREDGEKYKRELEEKTTELDNVRQQLAHLEEDVRQKNEACEAYMEQLQRSQELREEQSRQLSEALQHCAAHEAAGSSLQHELNRCNQVILERSSVANNARDHARHLASELAHVTKQAQRLDQNYREQADSAAVLQEHLTEAHARAAALCRDVRRVVGGVRGCVRALRARHRNQEEKINQQDELINSLRHRLEKSKRDPGVMRIEDDTCCTKCVYFRSRRGQGFANETASCSKCSKAKARREDCLGTSASEMPSGSAAPTPPRRLLRKKSSPCVAGQSWSAGSQCWRAATRKREMSPSSELEERVEALHAALERSAQRWAHAHSR